MRGFREFYAGKRVLVTGHTGFKGGWLCAWLKRCGAETTGLSLAPEPGRPSLFEEAGVADGMTSVIGDIRDPAGVADVFERCQPEIVFHLAAQPLVRRSYREPVETFATNVMGTAHVLEAARLCPSVRSVVAVTTDKCYENKEWVWGYRETDALGGKDPYSASKACAELVAASYRRSLLSADGRVRLATARGGNVIGGGDWSEDRIVPDVMAAILAGQPVVLRNPQAVRPWQHVLELVRGYMMLGCRLYDGESGPAFADAWNFGPGPGNEADVAALVERFIATWGASVDVRHTPSAIPEANLLKLAIDKSVTQLGWRPLLDFEETVRLTAAWYRAHVDASATAAALLDHQIDAYARRADG